MRVLVTGGNGYFGRLLIPALLARGHSCLSLDLQEGDPIPGADFLKADASDPDALELAASGGAPDVIFHLASQIDFASRSQRDLYRNNVECTKAVAEMAKKHRVRKVIFTSSNSVYLGNRTGRPILESDIPIPTDLYGRSKLASEQILRDYSDHFDSVCFRCPNIMDAGRVGLLSILYDFIGEGRKCWVLDDGKIRHQCIYAQDLIEACLKAVAYEGSATFNIGSDDVPTFREMYEFVIDQAKTGARIASIPMWIALPIMKSAYVVGLSPLGKYQFRMLTMDFVFDTTRVKAGLRWSPTLNNSQMLLKAYEHYHAHRDDIVNGASRSANQQAIKKLGILRLLKLIS